MNIVLATDDNFVQHCGVALLSILKHNKCVRIFLLTEGLKTDNENALRTIVESNGGVFNVCLVPSDIVQYFPMSKMASSHIGIATYYRLFVTALLPINIEKVIYLDCDMVIRGSLEELWNTDLTSKAMAAVYQSFGWSDHNDCWDRLWVPREYGYFNAGMLVMNLVFFREYNFQTKAVKFINDNFNRIISHDQDVLNSLLYDKTIAVSCKWNYLSLLLSDKLKDNDFPDRCKYVSEKKRNDFFPIIVHFVSKPKPWHYGCTNPYTHEYYDLLKTTQWAESRPQFVWKQYKEFVIIPSIKTLLKKMDFIGITERRHKKQINSLLNK